MKSNNTAIMVSGDANSHRNALTEEKYKELASTFAAWGYNVNSILYKTREMDWGGDTKRYANY